MGFKAELRGNKFGLGLVRLRNLYLNRNRFFSLYAQFSAYLHLPFRYFIYVDTVCNIKFMQCGM